MALGLDSDVQPVLALHIFFCCCPAGVYSITATLHFLNWGANLANYVTISSAITQLYGNNGNILASNGGGGSSVASASFTGYFYAGDTVSVVAETNVANEINAGSDSNVAVVLVS